MKKLAILIFIASLVLGIFVASIINWGSFTISRIAGDSFDFFSHSNGPDYNNYEVRNIGNFDAISVSGALSVELIEGDTPSVRLEGSQSSLSAIKTTVSGSTLSIEPESTLRFWNEKPKIVITAVNIRKIDLEGASKMLVKGGLANELSIELHGASDLKFDDGMSKNLDKMSATVSGASRLDSDAVSVREAWLDASGASKIKASVVEKLTANASGASKIKFKGNPLNKEINESGASKISGSQP